MEARTSLRDLADYVNQRVLAAALTAADVDVTDALYGAVSDEDALTTVYEAFASDDTPAERTARVQTRLTQLGVDVEAVEADWVTHPTVRTHLRECLDIETQRTATITTDEARDTIEWARTQCANIVNQTFTRLRNANVLVTGPLDVTVMIQITCTDCGTTYRPRQLLSRRECACTAADQSDGTTDYAPIVWGYHTEYVAAPADKSENSTSDALDCPPMPQQSDPTTDSDTSHTTLSVTNLGVIDTATVECSPGVTLLTGRNATNRTSLLRALNGALGGTATTLKSDAAEGHVTLTLGDDEFTRTVTRTGTGIERAGTPYTDAETLVDSFVTLLEDNPARRAVERGDDLHDVIMRPVDTEAIERRIRDLREEKQARVWIERTADDSVRGAPEPVFDLNVVREDETGTVYEDVVAHLSESEREVVGLVVALAGYLTHEASEVVPVMLLDSLEAIDSNRIAALVDYFADYVPHLVVALLPEDTEGLSADYERLTADALTAYPRRGGSFTSSSTI